MITRKLQYGVYAVLSTALVFLTLIGYPSTRESFRRFLGGASPFLVLAAAVAVGAACLSLLERRGWFSIVGNENARGLLKSAGIAAVLGLMMVAVDTRAVFPRDLNAPFPGSLAFYPAIGFIVEILFHVLPLTLLVFLMTFIFRSAARRTILWICIAAVCLLEPAYQLVLFSSGGGYPVWVAVYLGLHLAVFNGLQLALFKRYDFMSMYAFRLAYYLIWHIGWGSLRLKLLF